MKHNHNIHTVILITHPTPREAAQHTHAHMLNTITHTMPVTVHSLMAEQNIQATTFTHTLTWLSQSHTPHVTTTQSLMAAYNNKHSDMMITVTRPTHMSATDCWLR